MSVFVALVLAACASDGGPADAVVPADPHGWVRVEVGAATLAIPDTLDVQWLATGSWSCFLPRMDEGSDAQKPVLYLAPGGATEVLCDAPPPTELVIVAIPLSLASLERSGDREEMQVNGWTAIRRSQGTTSEYEFPELNLALTFLGVHFDPGLVGEVVDTIDSRQVKPAPPPGLDFQTTTWQGNEAVASGTIHFEAIGRRLMPAKLHAEAAVPRHRT